MIALAFALMLSVSTPGARAQETEPVAPPVAADISAVATSTTATIHWTTDHPSDTQVDFGATPEYANSTPLERELVVRHSAVLPLLDPGAVYHYRVKSRNARGLLLVSPDLTFTTPSSSPAAPENDGPPAPPPPATALPPEPAVPPRTAVAPEAAGPPEADRTPPSIVILTPAPGTFASKTITISANAVDNGGVTSVMFLLDGRAFAAPMAAPPYTFQWDTLTAPPGPHALAALARDAAGNTATSPVIPLTVDNTPPELREIFATAVSPSAAVVRWKTDERADSLVDYATTTAQGPAMKADPSMRLEHAVSLAGLEPATEYYYRVASRDQAGNRATSGYYFFSTGGPGAAAGAAADAADDAAARAPQKMLSPARADGINDKAAFGPAAREVSIFDLRGRLVFHATSAVPGAPIVWDCRDGAGRVLESGVYIATIVKRDGGRLTQSFSIAK